jgi:cell division protease FtsH
VTLSRTDGDRFTYTQAELFAMMRVLLGGRAAEAVALGEISTGAESDLAELTRLGRRMVGRWGMSDALGNIAALGRDDEPLMTPETVALVDAETRRLVDEIYQDVVRLLRAERGRLDSLVEALLEDETLDGGQARAAAGLAQSRV